MAGALEKMEESKEYITAKTQRFYSVRLLFALLAKNFASLPLNKNNMIKELRKKHLQIWTLLAVLIPVGIVAGWIAVPKKVTQELLQPPASKTSGFKIESIEDGNYKDTLKSK